jgi:hypothetical protein
MDGLAAGAEAGLPRSSEDDRAFTAEPKPGNVDLVAGSIYAVVVVVFCEFGRPKVGS